MSSRSFVLSRRSLALALATILSTPLPASAHAILESSLPAAGASVPAGPIALRLRFNSRIDRDRSVLTLIAPDKSRTQVPIATSDIPQAVDAAVTLPGGAYVLRWQVLAIDGHITRGDLPFTVTGP